MKRLIFIATFLAVCIQVTTGQKKYFTREAKISFYSRAPMEDIEARNTKALGAFDVATGQIEFSVLMKGFEFEKAKMQEHFNEDYIESDKFPKGAFTGIIKNPSGVKLDKDGVYKVPVSGSLTIHGVTKPQDADAVFTVKNGAVSALSGFTIALADYNIKVPSLVAEKVSKTVKIVIEVPSFQSR
jgi:polyisoprenoid-binding protein YceI